MRILFLTHRLPYPPDKGERIRAFYELKYFAQRHEVDLFSFADSEVNSSHLAVCQELCRSVYVEPLAGATRAVVAAWFGLRGLPLSNGFFYSSSFADRVHQALRHRSYDLIFVYCSSMGQYIPFPAPAPLVVDFVDADSSKWEQYAATARPPKSWLFAHEARTVAAFEGELLARAALSLAVTEHDAVELCKDAPGRHRVEVVPNGVDVPDAGSSGAADAVRELQPFVAFVGTMDYRPNADAAAYFAEHIFPLLRRTQPDLKFVIVGRNPGAEIQRLAALPQVVVTGGVRDVYPYFRGAEVTVAPFRISQGFHNKIAESLAVGTPVVTSSRAAAGIGLSSAEGLYTADKCEDFAAAVDRLILDVSLRNALRKAAPAVANGLKWDARLRRLEEMLVEVAARPQRTLAVAEAGR
jgi:polysaccharide biosynthesis protein PslH